MSKLKGFVYFQFSFIFVSVFALIFLINDESIKKFRQEEFYEIGLILILLYISSIIIYNMKNLVLVILFNKSKEKTIKNNKNGLLIKIFNIICFLIAILTLVLTFFPNIYILTLQSDYLNEFINFFKLIALMNILIYCSIIFDYYLIINGKKLDIF